MERRPFDPSLISVPPQERLAPPSLLTPRQVNDLVRGAIARHVPSTLYVVGEIGDLSRPASGHLYFTLKDSSSELRCVLWRSSAVRLRFEPTPGLEVIATGGLEVYTPRGSYQLVVRKLEPRGVGALELAFRQLRDKLQREGLFDPARKRALPRVPRRIAVITSPSGAAIRDILQTIRRRFPVPEILVFPVRVQGEGAAAEIAEAIRLMNRSAAALGGIDVAIVGRGGGSLEDLWAFNEEVVARAIYESAVPIVGAVGHEVDVSIADLVADVRAATPTAAAELVTPLLSELLERLERDAGRARRAATQVFQNAAAALQVLAATESLARPLNRLRQHAQRLDESHYVLEAALRARMTSARQALARVELAVARYAGGLVFARLRRRLERAGYRGLHGLGEIARRAARVLHARAMRIERLGPLAQVARLDERLRQTARRLDESCRQSTARRRSLLESRAEMLRACDPRRVLARGFSITRDARSRAVLRSIAQVREGQRLLTELADGEFRSTAEDPRQPRLFE